MFDYTNFFKNKISLLKKQSNYRIFKCIKKKAGTYPVVDCNDNPQTINFTGNDYLGLSTHPEVIAESINVLSNYGVGSGGTRNISGTTPYHIILEKTMADLHKKEKGLIFNSAYLANTTLLGWLGRTLPECVIFSDEKNHASIIEGIRLSCAHKVIFKHNDPEHLKQLLEEYASVSCKIIVFESVYSMHGTIGDISPIIDLAKKYNALTVLDEVHAVGLYGDKGAGIAQAEGLDTKIDFLVGTFGKAYGCAGGYVVGDIFAIDALRSFGAGFIFTTSMPPAILSACIKAVEINSTQDKWRNLFFENILYLKTLLRKNEINFLENNSHIICIMICESARCLAISEVLLTKHHIYVQAINYPTVAMGEELLRITITPLHTKKQIHYFCETLKKVIKQF